MSFKTFFSEQTRNPSGLFGRVVMSKVFDLGNAALNSFMKQQLEPEENDHVLEIGFGTGKLLNEIAKLINKGLIEGIDISETMVKIAKRKNKKFISQGKIIIKHGDFEKESYDDNSFTKICSVNTIYFWSEPNLIIRKIFNILKPGGKLIFAFEDKEQIVHRALDFDIFHVYSENEIKELLKLNGFSRKIYVRSKWLKSKKFHCCIAVK